MSKKNGFYENVKLRIKPKGRRKSKRIELTIILPQGPSSNLFSEIKSAVRKKRVRKQAAPEAAA